MTITVTVDYTYKEPVEIVAAIHLSKYPNKYDPHILTCETVHKEVTKTGLSCITRIAACRNAIPTALLRRIPALKVEEVKFEEECSWSREKRTLDVKSRNVTWCTWIFMEESSHYRPDITNKNWTYFSQQGIVTVHGLGRIGTLLEMFAKRFLTAGAHRSIRITEILMAEKSQAYFKFWYSQFIFA